MNLQILGSEYDLRKSNKALAMLGLLSAVLLLTTALASADEVYTYLGNPLSAFAGNPPAGMTQIETSFTTADPLAPNMVFNLGQDSNVQAIAFNIHETDGGALIGAGPNNLFGVQIATDGNGVITNWLIYGLDTNDFGTTTLILGTTNGPFGIYDVSCRGAAPYCNNLDFGDSNTWAGGDVAAIFNDSGSWSVTDTPEPSSIALMGSGVMAFAGIIRKRFFD